MCRVRSGLLVPYSNPYITGETAYALGIDRYGRLWCAMSTGKCAVMQDDRVLAMLAAALFVEDGSVIRCLPAARAHPSADPISRNAAREPGHQTNCIVLMHDSASTRTTAEALPDIIRWYADQGFAFLTVAEVLPVG